MQRPSFFLLVVIASVALPVAMSAQETAASAPTEPARRSLFSAAELDRFHAISIEREARRESYIRAPEDDDVVMLEPYIVEGDNSLVIARIRRTLERDKIGRGRIFVGLDDAARQELMFARRSQDDFFTRGSPGRPNDAPSFNGIDMLAAPGEIINALRNGRVGELFRAPPSKVGE